MYETQERILTVITHTVFSESFRVSSSHQNRLYLLIYEDKHSQITLYFVHARVEEFLAFEAVLKV